MIACPQQLLNYCLCCFFLLGTVVKLEKNKIQELIKHTECSDVLVECTGVSRNICGAAEVP